MEGIAIITLECVVKLDAEDQELLERGEITPSELDWGYYVDSETIEQTLIDIIVE